ncbi:hypothetical protein, partial [Streptomyces sp. EN27]|uniref:hypothetical protein n=1 Tax=Streptomyces sp. EN27 TaxID=211464 RepID=UPI00114D0A01
MTLSLKAVEQRLSQPAPEPLAGQQTIPIPTENTLSIMESFQPGRGKILYGIWNAVKNEDEWNERRWMEWWPSQADAFRSMRQRLCPDKVDFTTGNQCLARHIYQPDRPDAQFYGSKDGSCILLYDNPDADQPCEIIDFGPRGGLRRRAYAWQ